MEATCLAVLTALAAALLLHGLVAALLSN